MARFCSILLTFLLLAPTWVRADPPPAQVPAAKEDEAEQTLRAALEAYERGDLELANTLLERVHIEQPSARTLRGLGIVAFQQARYADAVVLLEQSLIHPDKPLDAELRANVQQLIALSRTHLGELTLRVTPADAQLFIDGRATVFASGTPLTVAVGAHELSLRREGYASKSLSIAIAAASALSLDVVLSKAAPEVGKGAAKPVQNLAATPSKDAAPPAQQRPVMNAARRRRMLWSGYAASALAVLAVGGAIATAAVASHRIEQIEEACRALPSNQCSVPDANRREEEKNLPRLGRIATAGLIVGGAAAAAGIPLLVLSYRNQGRHDSALMLDVRVRF